MTDKRGPYVNELQSKVYLPVSDYTLNEARHEAALHAQDTIGDWGRSRYEGKPKIQLHDHEDYEMCNRCPYEAVWAFETYEGTYRR
jgi:hypothetical protein